MNKKNNLKNNRGMLTLIIRAVVIYLLVLFVFRLMGKRQLGQMQPFELVLTLVIADLATIPMTETSIPILHGVIPLITLVVVHFFLTFFSKKNAKVGNFINGKPIILINPNGVEYEALENLDLSIEDVFEAIRSAGYFNLEEIQYAIMETNGTVNVLPKSQFAPVTNKDLELEPESASLPLTLVSEGNILQENLTLAGFDEKDVMEIARRAKIEKIKDILVLTINQSGSVYIQENKKPYKILQAEFKGGQFS